MTETVYIYNHWTTGWSFTKKIKYANQNPKMASGGSRGGRRERSPPMKKKKKKKKREREREREFAPHQKKRERARGGGGRCSVPLLSISAFIHSPVKCNKSLYMFTCWRPVLVVEDTGVPGENHRP